MILQDKVALVTGGTSGIGRATAIAYAQQQAKVVVGRRIDEGEETVRLIQEAGKEAIFVQADVTKETDAEAMVDKAVSVFGRLDIAFNNAGTIGENPSLIEQTEAEYDRIMNVNVKGVWLSMKYEIAQMLKQGSGAIVNMASVAGFVAVPLLLYTASKHAVVGLTKAAALQYAKAGIEIPSLFIITQGELAQMESMKAAVLTGFGDAEKFEIQTVPTPQPKANQVLVRVCATSINPVDYQTRRGDYKELVRLPAILGVDVSGVIEAVGEAVTDFKVGDNVYYSPQVFGEFGSYAQYHVADAAIVALKPANLSHIEAASFPLAGGTAWDCLVTRGNLQVGETVLIHAGAGGVGSIAVQLAKAIGAYVFATCSSRNRDFVTELGADRVIDYKNEDYAEVIRQETNGLGVDLVLDTIGGETIQRSLEIIRPFGRLTSIVDIAIPQSLLKAWGKNLTIHFVLSPQYRAKLEALTKLIERHQLRPVIDSVFSWDQVVLAHQRLEQGGTRGKIVLKFTEN
jgi:NADPH:quinone reductase-like Zn-dependent oxidoreductase/NADP-dependent 3-hydroxy acid dehydrogenase YdfG